MKLIFDDFEFFLNIFGDILFFVCIYNDGYDIYFVILMEIILNVLYLKSCYKGFN